MTPIVAAPPLDTPAGWLPVVFLVLMGLAMLAYVVLDGYDLGVGMLLPRAPDTEKDTMIASIGPFWDANETWLVLGVGVLLIAFPRAHGMVLTALYLPVAAMLIGLVLRGVAFDFRVKARDEHKPLWNKAFFAGSMLASLAQGWMLGRYIVGLERGGWFTAFAAVIALALPATYTLIGATWLVMKTDGDLQRRARDWALTAWWPFVAGMGLISVATPLVSPTVRDRWFTMPGFLALLPIPLATAALLLAVRGLLANDRIAFGRRCWWPFVAVVALFCLGFVGLAYSVYPFVVMDRLTIWQAAAAPESLALIGIGCAITVPAIVGYTIYAYRVFWGKARTLQYA